MNNLVPAGVKSAVRSVVVRLAGMTHVPVRVTVDPYPIALDSPGNPREFFGRPKFFVIGYPRSGTTLLGRLLRIHPSVYCEWQAHFFTEAASLWAVSATSELEDWGTRSDNRWLSDRSTPTAMLRTMMDYVMESRASQEGAEVVGDKSPADHWSEALDKLHAIYPDARIIHIVRDGRDVALSRRIQQFVDHPDQLDRYGQRMRRALGAGRLRVDRLSRSIFGRAWLRQEALKWDHEVREVKYKGERFYGDRITHVRFEDLIGDPIRIVPGLWEFLLGEPARSDRDATIMEVIGENPAANWHSEAAPTIVNGIPRGRAGGWKSVFTAQDAEVYWGYARGGLQAWGYEGPAA